MTFWGKVHGTHAERADRTLGMDVRAGSLDEAREKFLAYARTLGVGFDWQVTGIRQIRDWEYI